MEGIKETLDKFPSGKTPGPDSMTVEFFKATWSVLGDELSKAIINFFYNSFIPTFLNFTSLVLIQKRVGVEVIQDYRPISCLNTVYKVIARILANKLKAVLPDIVLQNQTAFVKDRLLMENVLLASEVVNDYHKSLQPGRITLKVDISKAFDSVRCDFLLSALQAYKVSPTFCNAIRTCVCSPSFSVSINGTSLGYFKGKMGLRQGDPLSSTLFVLALNVLSLMLNKGADQGFFNYHPDCEDLCLTHPSFTDDLLMFLDGSMESLEGVYAILNQFEKMSGLAVNISKTSMFCSGIAEGEQTRITDKFGLFPKPLPIRYLGLPLCSRRLSLADCDPLLRQVRRKINVGHINILVWQGGSLYFPLSFLELLGFGALPLCFPNR